MAEYEQCFIMLCNNKTENECIGRNLFGDREWRLEYLKEIKAGDLGVLLNTTKNELIGFFEAKSEVELDIEEDAWQGEFRAQVRVKLIDKLKRIAEAQTVLATIGVELTALPSGALVPICPTHGRVTTVKLIAYFREADCTNI